MIDENIAEVYSIMLRLSRPWNNHSRCFFVGCTPCSGSGVHRKVGKWYSVRVMGRDANSTWTLEISLVKFRFQFEI